MLEADALAMLFTARDLAKHMPGKQFERFVADDVARDVAHFKQSRLTRDHRRGCGRRKRGGTDQEVKIKKEKMAILGRTEKKKKKEGEEMGSLLAVLAAGMSRRQTALSGSSNDQGLC